MAENNTIEWEAYEFRPTERSADWFWAIAIVFVSLFVATAWIGNYLFAMVILLSGGILMLLSNRDNRIIPFAVSSRGVRIDDTLHHYPALNGYNIVEEENGEMFLLLETRQYISPILAVPIPPEDSDSIEAIVSKKVEHKDLEEPPAHRVLEFFGF